MDMYCRADRFMLYLNPTAEGFAETDACTCPPCCHNVSISIDIEYTLELLKQLRTQHKLGAAVSAFSGYGPPGG